MDGKDIVAERVNSSYVDYRCSCINCGAVDGLLLFPHRNEQNKMVGMVYACEKCAPVVRDRKLILLDSWGPGKSEEK